MEGNPTVTFIHDGVPTTIVGAVRVTLPDTPTDITVIGIKLSIKKLDERIVLQFGNADPESHFFSSSKCDWARR